MSRRFFFLLLAASVMVPCAVSAQSGAGTSTHQHDHHNHSAMGTTEVKRSEAIYKIPTVALQRQDGKKASFPGEIDDGRAVILQFMYTSCTTVCPITTQMFSEVKEQLGKEKLKFHMVSISIDPEFDNLKRLDAFSKKMGAGEQWQFYTGTLEGTVALQKAFDVYRGDKMNHVPVTFLRAAPGKPWVRLDGLRGPEDIVKEYRALSGKA
jgi:protein SCO1/2